MDAIARLNALQNMPKTHAVLTAYDNGDTLRHETRSATSAEMYAVGERRKIGKTFISRETDQPRTVMSVEITTL